MEQWGRHELWEGCIEWELPGKCTDSRTLRDLPQNQEVFLAEGKDSFLFDLMEMVDEPHVEEAARVHWNDLAETNELDARGVTMKAGKVRVPSGGATRSVPVVSGMQGDVRVWLALLRLPEYQTDVVISWNEVEWAGRDERDSEATFLRILASVRMNDLSFLKSQ
jgi:hypothetical protein